MCELAESEKELRWQLACGWKALFDICQQRGAGKGCPRCAAQEHSGREPSTPAGAKAAIKAASDEDKLATIISPRSREQHAPVAGAKANDGEGMHAHPSLIRSVPLRPPSTRTPSS
eukprot:6180558-Pleurochrysis_carterae.AAC.3